jgi:DnaD/phage-associated family protein
MTRSPHGAGEFGFVEALMKRGFINIPRMLFDYMPELGLDYDRIGRIYSIMAYVGGPGESAFGLYTVTRRAMPRDFDQIRSLALQLEEGDVPITRVDAVSDNEISFSFAPLYSRLRAVWEDYRHKFEEEQAQSGPHPAVAMVEKLLGRPLSDRDVRDVLEWVDEYGFSLEMIEAVIQEGRRQGIIKMSYLNRIAQGWAEAGIETPEQAAAHMQEHQKLKSKHTLVTQALGILRPLTATEQAMLDRWFNEWGFHDNVILQACERAAGSKNPLQYTNKVLEAWLAEGVRTPADLEQMVEQRKRNAAAARNSNAGPVPGNKQRGRGQSSNVILRREKKDESDYDYIYKKFGE